MELKEQIINDIKNNPVILYMKGTRDMPMCGFQFCSAGTQPIWCGIQGYKCTGRT